MEPINLSKPNWQCPICGTEHGDDLDTAKACVAFGEPDGAGAADEILVWTHGIDGWHDHDAALKLITLDKVKLERDGYKGPLLGHVLTYSDGSPATLGLGVEPGEIVEVGGDRAPEAAGAPDRGSLGDWLVSIGAKTKGEKHGTGKRWPHHDKYGHSDETDYYGGGVSVSNIPTPGPWIGPLTDDVRSVFETLLTDRWERLVAVEGATDIIDRPGHVRRGEFEWAGVGTYHRGGVSSGFQFPLRDAIYDVACAHGFGYWDHIGVTRWTMLTKPTVVAWLHDRFYRWVHGEDVTIPRFGAHPVTAEPGFHGGLPKKPNKKRVEALARWGVDPERWGYYNKVAEAAIATLHTDPPINPIPGVIDAVTFRSKS